MVEFLTICPSTCVSSATRAESIPRESKVRDLRRRSGRWPGHAPYSGAEQEGLHGGPAGSHQYGAWPALQRGEGRGDLHGAAQQCDCHSEEERGWVGLGVGCVYGEVGREGDKWAWLPSGPGCVCAAVCGGVS